MTIDEIMRAADERVSEFGTMHRIQSWPLCEADWNDFLSKNRLFLSGKWLDVKEKGEITLSHPHGPIVVFYYEI